MVWWLRFAKTPGKGRTHGPFLKISIGPLTVRIHEGRECLTYRRNPSEYRSRFTSPGNRSSGAAALRARPANSLDHKGP